MPLPRESVGGLNLVESMSQDGCSYGRRDPSVLESLFEGQGEAQAVDMEFAVFPSGRSVVISCVASLRGQDDVYPRPDLSAVQQLAGA